MLKANTLSELLFIYSFQSVNNNNNKQYYQNIVVYKVLNKILLNIKYYYIYISETYN